MSTNTNSPHLHSRFCESPESVGCQNGGIRSFGFFICAFGDLPEREGGFAYSEKGGFLGEAYDESKRMESWTADRILSRAT